MTIYMQIVDTIKNAEEKHERGMNHFTECIKVLKPVKRRMM
jgi:hypothetical protein